MNDAEFSTVWQVNRSFGVGCTGWLEVPSEEDARRLVKSYRDSGFEADCREVPARPTLSGALAQWSQAYPEDVFPPLNKDEIAWLNSERPGLCDRISAAMGRHIVKRLLDAEPHEAATARGAQGLSFAEAAQRIERRFERVFKQG